jgi:hypothetical protein
MPMKLRKLKITRVAVCEQGANYDVASGTGAHILLFKSAEVAKQEGVTVSDVYTDTFAGTARCTDPACADPHCPVHGALVRARRKKKRVAKGPIDAMGMHGEPDGDEEPPLDYATRGQQYDLWEQLWGKWECFCTTFYDCIGDGDEDNVPHLPILVDSIGQFQADVAQLLEDCGVAKQVAPLLLDLHTLCQEDVRKAGAAMATHRRKRLQDAIAALQQLLEECTPDDYPHGTQPPIDRAGVSAAEVAGLSGAMGTPALSKGASAMAVRKNATSDKEHCDSCDDKDCDNPAHERMKNMEKQAEERIADLEATLAKAHSDLVQAQSELAARETTIAKMRQTPEEQEAEYWASVPEPVRKKYEAGEAEKVELRKQLDDARQEREQTVYIAKTADFRSFGMVQKHWRILKAIDRMDPEDSEELLRLIKAAQEQARTSGLFTATGTEGRNGSTSMEGGSASERLMALTQARMEEKGEDFLKASEAIAKSHRELYAEANRERRQASRVSSQ